MFGVQPTERVPGLGEAPPALPRGADRVLGGTVVGGVPTCDRVRGLRRADVPLQARVETAERPEMISSRGLSTMLLSR